MSFYDEMTLKEARDELRELVGEGHSCPCCRQFAKVYKRKLNATMVGALGRLFVAAGSQSGVFVHAPTELAGSRVDHRGDVGKLAFWGFVREDPAKREDGGRAGWWHVTPDGVSFLRGLLRVPKYAHVYDGKLLRLTGEAVGIGDVAPTFRLDDLMAGV